MKKIFLFTIAIFSLSSCIIQILNDNYYSYLTPQQQAKIKHLEYFEEARPGYVYKITGKQLQEELYKHEKSLVHVFVPGCKSDNCHPLSQIKQYADENGLKLFLIMNGYYKMNEPLDQNIDLPLFSINNEAYNEDKSRKYYKRFTAEIGYQEHLDKTGQKFMPSYVFYEKGHIVESKRYLFEDEIQAVK